MHTYEMQVCEIHACERFVYQRSMPTREACLPEKHAYKQFTSIREVCLQELRGYIYEIRAPLAGMHLMGVYRTGVPLMGMYLMGVHRMGVPLTGVSLTVCISLACSSRA